MVVARVFLGEVRSHLGKSLCRRNAYAYGHSYRLQYTVVELCAPLLELSGRESVENGERLVDGVAEAHGRHVAYDGHDASGYFAIKFII